MPVVDWPATTRRMSATSKTKTRRQNKTTKSGRARKKQLEKKGTTPKFPIHPESK